MGAMGAASGSCAGYTGDRAVACEGGMTGYTGCNGVSERQGRHRQAGVTLMRTSTVGARSSMWSPGCVVTWLFDGLGAQMLGL